MKTRGKNPIKIIGERNIDLRLENPAHHEQISAMGKALSSKTRLAMMVLLRTTPLSIQEIAELMSLPVSSTALHIKCLEDAKLVITESQPGIRGSQRICLCTVQSIGVHATDLTTEQGGQTIAVDMPVGGFYRWDVLPTCGWADEKGHVESYDTPKSFYSPNRPHAQLVWFQQGYLEYRFPNHCENLIRPTELSFSMELCSEAPGYAENWPSDITISVNGVELGTYCAPGDYGARRGLLTPDIWRYGSTQYGMLKTFALRKSGAYIDGELVNDIVSIDQLTFADSMYISLRIEIKNAARHIGGINLFGEKFGDYPQGIVMRIVY